MSENKFIAKLKGEPTPKSVVEIQNDRLVAPFKSSPMGHIADRDSSVVVAKGAQNWAVNQGQLVPVADDYIGTESNLSGISRVSGAGLWLNATYTFPATGDETNPVSAIIAPSAKWVLTLCGDSLITQNGSVITLTMLVKIGATHLTTKQFKIRECASQFSQRLAIDFSESEQKVIKAHGGSPLTVQVLCDDEGASATIYSGMTHLTLLQRKIDAELVSTDNVLLPEFIENLLEGYIIPADYFSRYDYIEQVEDGAKAMPEFTRNGDDMTFSGWAKPAEEVYTKTEIDNKFTVANAQIDANATAIVKTRDDMNAEDSRLQTQITAQATAITTNKNDIDELGDDVAEIQAKIPESASGSNPLITKQQLATKQDKLTAGDNIIISNNVISATGTGGAGFDAIVVQELPESGLKGVIYLVPSDGETPDVYDEYLWIESTGTFELIGKTKVDLSGYATKEDLENIELLPDQTDNAGKFLMTDGATTSWSDKPLVNKSSNTKNLAILGGVDNNAQYNTVIGYGASSYGGDNNTVVGANSQCRFNSTLIGAGIQNSITKNAVIIGSGNTGLSVYGVEDNSFTWIISGVKYKLFSADGTMPSERIGNLDFGTMD